jgi:hypothetical protein
MALALVQQGKVIPKSYATIQHLPGSKMIDAEDKLLGSVQVKWLTERRRTISVVSGTSSYRELYYCRAYTSG